ncbi:uncharacterized protein LOC144711099 [Wolffia australiana]
MEGADGKSGQHEKFEAVRVASLRVFRRGDPKLKREKESQYSMTRRLCWIKDRGRRGQPSYCRGNLGEKVPRYHEIFNQTMRNRCKARRGDAEERQETIPGRNL